MAYYFGQQSIPAQIFGFLVGLSFSQIVNLRKYLRPQRQDLLICDEEGWRPLHFLVAQEILIQLLSGQNEREQWSEMLSHYAVEIINLLGDAKSRVSDNLNKIVSDILYNLFIERRTQDLTLENSPLEGRSKFSDYIERIPVKEGKRLVFDTLVEIFPEESHFWGHRSRFIWSYAKDIPDYEEAIKSAEYALAVGGERPDFRLYHIKGMALSRWATHLMEIAEQELNESVNEISNEQLSEIQKLFDEALAIFKYIREELRPTEERPYVTAIQLLTRYIEFGKMTSSFETYASFFRSPSSRNYRQYLEEAERLLHQIYRMQAGESTSQFVKQREIQLSKLYDDHSRVIEGWQNLLARTDVYRPPYRRSLAYAYLARRNRDWDKLTQKELSIIRDMMEENLLAEPGNNHNVRLWFEAAKRLSSTGLNYAIEKLTYWASNANNIDALDANYYLYILQAVAAIEGSELAATQARRSIEQCKGLAQHLPNRTFSFEWIGKKRGIARLVNHSLLGKLSSETLFFDDTSLLERLSGRIDKIDSRQAGRIKAYGLTFFFTPSPRAGHQFVPGRNENDPVTFFVGFSYDGPRAWDVKPVELP